MKFLKIVIILGLLINLLGCSKLEKIKNKMNPGSPYKKAGIDRFYWEAEDDDKYIIPLTKPLRLIKWKANKDWNLETSIMGWKYGDIGPVSYIYIKDLYVFGLQDFSYDETGEVIDLSSFFFIINTKTKEINTYDYNKEKKQFEEELRKLNLPEKYLEPQNIYWEFERYPDLEWFPEDVKKQLREVKTSLKK